MKCPYCDVKLQVDEMIDRNEDNNFVGGHCPKCDKMFAWTQHFKLVFSHEDGLIED